MAHDGSLASLTEAWVVARIQAIGDPEAPVFEDVDVVSWEGSLQKNAQDTADELLAGKRNAIARVRYRRDTVIPLEAGEQRHEALYEVFVGVRNERPAAARTGDGERIGTNGMRDLLFAALHRRRPNLNANGRYTDQTRWGGSEVAYNTKNAAILYAMVRVDEVPANA